MEITLGFVEEVFAHLTRMNLRALDSETLLKVWGARAAFTGGGELGSDGRRFLDLLVEIEVRRILQRRGDLPRGEYPHPSYP